MHQALPARKPSNPSSYATRSFRIPMLRRSRVQAMVLCACALGVVLFILSRVLGGSDVIDSGMPSVVIVTTLDPDNFGKEYIQSIKENRIEYAQRHGYATFFPNTTDYDLNGSPSSWARVPAVRHAMTKFSQSTYIWFLDQNAYIMNPDLTVHGHIMNANRLEHLMLRDKSIVPPDKVIKTFSHLKGSQIDLVLTQDIDGLADGSFIIRRGEWSKFFLDTWFDPLYRSYNFQKAETHALEHIVQWHPTILSRLAIVPQQIMNAYNKERSTDESEKYKDGDFIVCFAGCERNGRDCAQEAHPFLNKWQTTFHGKQ